MIQRAPLEVKIERSKNLIREAIYEFGKDKVYGSYSGGKDREVLSDLLLQIYPDMAHLFANTTVEYPETYERAREKKKECNLLEIKPKMSFKQVIEKYGYPMFLKK